MKMKEAPNRPNAISRPRRRRVSPLDRRRRRERGGEGSGAVAGPAPASGLDIAAILYQVCGRRTRTK
jgi:hypothetical protein